MMQSTAKQIRAVPPATLADALVSQASQRGDAVAFRFLGTRDARSEEAVTTVRYRDLHHRACAVAAALREVAAPGDRALLLYEPGPDYIGAFFGCLYAGIVAVPVYPPSSPASRERLDKIVVDAAPKVFLTTHALLPACRDAGLETAKGHADAPLGLATGDRWEEPGIDWQPQVSARDTAFLQYTSGSTGDPKGVVLSHANLLANITEYAERISLRSDDRRVSWLPPYHDMGLIGGILLPIVSGTEAILMSPFAFLRDPISWLEAISTYQGTYSTAPNFGYDLCVKKITPERFASLDLRAWRVAGVGAEPPRRSTMDRFAARFVEAGFRASTYLPGYGLAEATLVATTQVPGLEPRTRVAPAQLAGFAGDREESLRAAAAKSASEVVSSGVPLPTTVIKIVNPTTREVCRDGEIGEIWVRSPSVARGYWNRAQETEEVFGATLAGDPERLPHLRSGDLGFVDSGELFCSGRMKDLVIIRGRNYYPQDIEETISRADPSLRPGCCAVFSIEDDDEEHLIAVQECVADTIAPDALRALAKQLRGEVGRVHGVPLRELVLVQRHTSLKTSSGKIRRHATRAAYLEDRLTVVGRDRLGASGSSDGRTDEWFALESLEDKLRFAMASALGRPSVTSDDDFFALGGDSLRVIEAVTIASEQGIELEPEQIYAHPTVRQLVTLLEGAAAPASDATTIGQELNVVLRAPIPRIADAATHPLSPVQRRWALDYLGDRTKTWVNVSLRLSIEGPVSEDVVRRALAVVWTAHESLRTVFPEIEGELRQQILPNVVVPLRSWPAAEKARVGALEAGTVFDLTQGPLARAALFFEPNGDAELLLTLHHMIADGWSLVVVRKQLAAAIDAGRKGDSISAPATPSIRYRDYAEWMLGVENADLLASSCAYWKAELTHPLPTTLRVEDAIARGTDMRGASVICALPQEVKAAVKLLAQRHRVSDAAVLMAAFFHALHAQTGGDDLIVGTPLAGRERADTRAMVGMFINLVPVRVRALRDWTFERVVKATHEKVLGAVTHQRFQLDSMVDCFGLARESHCFPITNTFFTRVDMGGVNQPELPKGLTVRELPIDVRFHAMLYVYEYGDGYHVELRYRRALFETNMMRDLVASYVASLLQKAGTP